MNKAGMVCLLLSLGLVTAGCSQAEDKPVDSKDSQLGYANPIFPKPEETLKGTVGDTMSFNKMAITLNSVEKEEEFSTSDETYLICNVTVKNNSEEKEYFTKEYFLLQTGLGQELSPFGAIYTGEGSLSSFSSFYISPGGEFTGDVVFEISPEDDDFILNYYYGSIMLEEPTISWDFKSQFPDALKEAENYDGAGVKTIEEVDTQKLKLGETGTAAGLNITVKDALYDSDRSNFSGLNDDEEFLILTVQLENKTGKRIEYDSRGWLLQDSKLVENSVARSYTLAADNVLDEGRLADGGMVEGQLVFLIPKDSTDISLNYYSEFKWGDPDISWSIR